MAETGKIVAVTGHRPQKLGGFSEEVFQDLVRLAKHCFERLKPLEVITGMALGWDQAVAQACHDLKIPFRAYIPFMGQESQWPQQSQERYWKLLEGPVLNMICEPGYAAWKMQKRNEAMVDDCHQLLALWDGTTGGTFNCVAYARKQLHVVVLNCWQRWANKDF